MDNYKYSELAHEIAKELIYPQCFRRKFMSFEIQTIRGYAEGATEVEKILDGLFAVDYIVYEKIWFLHEKELISGQRKRTIQERFVREMNDSITISVQTTKGKSGELFKLDQVSVFVYGQYDEENNCITDWIAIEDIQSVVNKVISQEISYTPKTNRKTGTKYISIKIKELDENNIQYMRMGDNTLLH